MASTIKKPERGSNEGEGGKARNLFLLILKSFPYVRGICASSKGLNWETLGLDCGQEY